MNKNTGATLKAGSVLEPIFEMESPLRHLLNTDWHYQYIDTHDLYLSNRETIMAAMTEAPDKIAYSYVYSIFEMRVRIALLSNRGFD